jgi:glycosyltransferase involved in cell wall biosynthesis
MGGAVTRVSVLVPTFRRPEGFLRAARSVFAQRDVVQFELVAIDNSPEGSALATFRALEREAPIPFRWAHEPMSGVANARNAAFALARGAFVAWLDDDEEASPLWLAALLRVRQETGAQGVFGPVEARAYGANSAFYEQLYSRVGPQTSGLVARAYGMGNSLQPRAMYEGEGAPFDTRANHTGGEDDALFAAWREAGARFAWAADAHVVEHVTAERTTLAYGIRRAFAYGQAPCETAWSQRDYAALARHMTIGAGQALVFGAASSVAMLGSTSQGLRLFDRAVRGAGKVFWFCEQKFYGASAPAAQLA